MNYIDLTLEQYYKLKADRKRRLKKRENVALLFNVGSLILIITFIGFGTWLAWVIYCIVISLSSYIVYFSPKQKEYYRVVFPPDQIIEIDKDFLLK